MHKLSSVGFIDKNNVLCFFQKQKNDCKNSYSSVSFFLHEKLNVRIITSILPLIGENVKSNCLNNKPYFAIHRKP